MSLFYAIVTSLGAAKFADLVANGRQLVLKDFAVGDGNGVVYEPSPSQIALRRETYRGVINTLAADPGNIEQIIVECLLPENTGGYYIRELGIFDEDNDLIILAKYPSTYKPSPSDGALLKEYTIKVIMQVGTPDNVTLSVAAGSIATIEYVDDKKTLLLDETVVNLSNDDKYLTAHVFANLKATTTKVGVTRYANDLEVQNQNINDAAITPGSIPGLRTTLAQLIAGVVDRFITPAVLLQLLATTTQRGIVELATDSETQAQSSDSLAVTPKNLTALKATLAQLIAGVNNRYLSPDVLLQLDATDSQKGLVYFATDPEALGQSANNLAITPANLAALKATLAELQAGANNIKYITPALLNQLLATTTQKGIVELATDPEALAQSANDLAITPANLAALKATLAELQAGSNTVKYITPSVLALLDATDSQKGLVYFATDPEALAMTATDLAVTPKNLAGVVASIGVGFSNIIVSGTRYAALSNYITSSVGNLRYVTQGGYINIGDISSGGYTGAFTLLQSIRSDRPYSVTLTLMDTTGFVNHNFTYTSITTSGGNITQLWYKITEDSSASQNVTAYFEITGFMN